MQTSCVVAKLFITYHYEKILLFFLFLKRFFLRLVQIIANGFEAVTRWWKISLWQNSSIKVCSHQRFITRLRLGSRMGCNPIVHRFLWSHRKKIIYAYDLLHDCDRDSFLGDLCIPTNPLTPAIYYRPQGNVFTGVCQSFCQQGGGGLLTLERDPLTLLPDRDLHPPLSPIQWLCE